jgi:toxic protein SymE
MKTRKVKISYIVTKGKRFQGKQKENINPKITITGEWLKSAGFEIGQSIKIDIQRNKLILTNQTP